MADKSDIWIPKCTEGEEGVTGSGLFPKFYHFFVASLTLGREKEPYLKKLSAPDLKTYIFGIVLQFPIDLLKRNFWLFVSDEAGLRDLMCSVQVRYSFMSGIFHPSAVFFINLLHKERNS